MIDTSRGDFWGPAVPAPVQRRKVVLFLFLGLGVVAAGAYYLFFPRDTFICFSRRGGGTIVFSRGGISFMAPPDRYTANGFDQIGPYVSRLLVATSQFKSVLLFTPDGRRGFALSAKDGTVQAALTIDWRQEAQREADTRALFSSLGIAPSQDYLAGNGGVSDATRILEYPLSGSAGEVTTLTKRILQELCGVSPTEALDIAYLDK